MSRPVFGVDRDPLAAATWAQPLISDDEWDQWGGFCEVHGENRQACEAFERHAQAEADRDAITAGQPIAEIVSQQLSHRFDHR